MKSTSAVGLGALMRSGRSSKRLPRTGTRPARPSATPSRPNNGSAVAATRSPGRRSTKPPTCFSSDRGSGPACVPGGWPSPNVGAWRGLASRSLGSSPSSYTVCGATAPTSASAARRRRPSPPDRGRPRDRVGLRATWFVPAGDEGQDDLVESREPGFSRS